MKPAIKAYLLFALFIISATAGLQAQQSLSLDSCLAISYRNNLQLATAQLDRQSAIIALQGARLSFLPSVSASGSQGWTWHDGTQSTRSASINGSLTLFDGLSKVRTLQQAAATADQQDLQLQQSANTIASKIIAAYLAILMDGEKLSYQQEVLQTAAEQLSEGETKYNVGRLLESDYQLLRANHISAQAEIDNLQLSIADNYRTLRDLMHTSQSFTVASMQEDVQYAELQPVDSILSSSQSALPDWQISAYNVELARYNVDIARAAFLPQVSLNAGLGYNGGSYTASGTTTSLSGGTSGSLTLGVSVPLFDRGASLTQYRQSRLRLQEAILAYEQDSIALASTIIGQYNETQRALTSYRKYSTLADAYHSSYDVYVLKYQEGAVTTVEMLQQQDRYLSAQNDLLQSKYTYLLSLMQLQIYAGHRHL